MSIYRYEPRLWLILEGPHGIKQSKNIIPENKEKLLEYAKFLEASGKSPARQDKVLRTLKQVAMLLGDVHFKKATKKNIVDVLARIKGADSTRRDYQIILKQFYAWFHEIEDPRHEGYPKVVSWIHPKEPRSKLKASDLLTPQEVKRLIDATTDLRMKALIAICYECGLRIGEALKLKVGDVRLEEQCASLTVCGKTGPRQAFSIESLPLLAQWLDAHPDRNNHDAWLWTGDTEPLTYDRARFKLLQLKKKTKIRKRIYFHLFRHSSATRNAGLGEPMLRKIYGWSKNSGEPGTYVHLSGEAVKEALLEKHGLKHKPEKLKIVFCPRCNSPNQPDASLCIKCRSVLKLEDAVSIHDLRNKVQSLQLQVEALSTLMTPYTDLDHLRSLAETKRRIIKTLKKRGLTVKN